MINRTAFRRIAADESDRRLIRLTPIDLLDYAPAAGPDDRRPRLAPIGSVSVYIGHEGSKTLQAVRAAVEDGGDSDLDVAARIYETYVKRGTISAYRAWRALRSQPVWAEVRYGGRTLAKNVAVPPGLDFIPLPSLYNGGPLTPAKFTLVERFVDGTDTQLEAVALKRPPVLTEAEQHAVAEVPEAVNELNIAPRAGCGDSDTDYAMFVVATMLIMAGPNPEALADVPHISDADLSRLSAGATALELMEIRREVTIANEASLAETTRER